MKTIESTGMQQTKTKLNTIELASAFAMVSHDIKNSLGILLRDINKITGDCQVTGCGLRKECADMEYEVRRINSNLVKMLTLFKVEQGDYMLNIDAHSVYEFIEELMLEHGLIMREKEIDYTIDCADDLFWYFDRNLMTGVLGNAINNAIRYTKSRIRIAARSTSEGLQLAVEDNGLGFTPSMLEQQVVTLQEESGFINNNTSLGIYFTKLALDMHQHDGLSGKIAMQNGGELGGGQFFMSLP
jgi:K+-sensing histidine kinase KdpD